MDGPQRGVSATQAIKVFSAAEHSRESLIRAQALWERLVALLGDRLEEKPPPQDAEAAAQWYAQTGQKDREARALSQDLYAAGTELLKDKLAPKAVGRALRYASRAWVRRCTFTGPPALRFLGASGRDDPRVNSAARSGRDQEEEKDPLLEDLLDQARLDAMQGAGEAGGLAARLRAWRRSCARPRTRRPRELLAEVDRLRERIRDLMQRMSSSPKASRTST